MTDLRTVAVLSAAAAFLFGTGVLTGRSMAPGSIVIAPVAVPALAAPSPPAPPPPVPPPVVNLPPDGDPDPSPPAMVWGASVRDLSTQYETDEWSAKRALGAPDVWPASGDQVNAWASESADDRPEFLEVALARPTRLSGAEVLETFNPGAVTAIELIGASGAHQVVYRGKAVAMSQAAYRRRVDFACTGEPIVAIRVAIDSPAVPGWNEIDAIGGQPCREQ